jgi:two-component system OmpR family sensor kinase
MSLRARLIAVLLVVAALGLVALAAITYAEQRSYLLDRTAQQARAALPVVEHQLFEGGRDDDDVMPSRGGGPPPGEVNLPPGTYGVVRSASGSIVAGPFVASYGQEAPDPPELPDDLAPGKAVTVDAQGSGAPRYRVEATPLRGSTGSVVVAVPLGDVDATLDRLLAVLALVIVGVLLVLGVAAAWLVRLGLRPLDRMGTTAGIIAGGDLSRRVDPATNRTEVGRLGLALNAMLGRLEVAFAEKQASEERLRRFLSDASHELRTPLASIRGYAELFRMGATRTPEEVERAMRRIEEEAARMGLLVEDLLALARLDELRDPVRTPVDVAAIARDAVDDARATAPGRPFALEAEPGATVLGDPGELRQVLANLLRNAVVHTPPDSLVDVAVTARGDDVRIRVRDHGPGLPTEDPDALFDRFWRAEPGRERGPAGSGLGLAIVAGIVEAHHGRVHAENAPDGGACFTVLLPAAAPEPAGVGA